MVPVDGTVWGGRAGVDLWYVKSPVLPGGDAFCVFLRPAVGDDDGATASGFIPDCCKRRRAHRIRLTGRRFLVALHNERSEAIDMF